MTKKLCLGSHTTIAEKVAAESKFARAAAAWVANATRKDVTKIYGVDFTVIHGGYCETCGYTTTGIEYYYNGKLQEYEFGYGSSVGEFLEECTDLLEENQS